MITMWGFLLVILGKLVDTIGMHFFVKGKQSLGSTICIIAGIIGSIGVMFLVFTVCILCAMYLP